MVEGGRGGGGEGLAGEDEHGPRVREQRQGGHVCPTIYIWLTEPHDTPMALARHANTMRHDSLVVSCLIAPPCPILSPGMALWRRSHVVPCRWACRSALPPVLARSRHAVIIAWGRSCASPCLVVITRGRRRAHRRHHATTTALQGRALRRVHAPEQGSRLPPHALHRAGHPVTSVARSLIWPRALAGMGELSPLPCDVQRGARGEDAEKREILKEDLGFGFCTWLGAFNGSYLS